MTTKLSLLLAIISSIVLGTTIDFNGTSDYVSVADDATFDVTTAITVEAWVYRNASQTGYRAIATRQDGITIYEHWYLGLGFNEYICGVVTTSGTSTSPSTGIAPVGEWNHLAMTYDGSTVTLYIDGLVGFSVSHTGTMSVDDRPIMIGAANNGNPIYAEHFDGKIDEVRVWDYARTQSQIQSTMYCPPTGSETGLILYHKNNDGSGTTATDETANANDGALSGGTWVTVTDSPAPSASNADGNWATPGTWLAGVVPASVDYNCVEINDIVTLDDGARATGSLKMNAGHLTLSSVARATDGSLTVADALTLGTGYILTSATNSLTLKTTATTSGGSTTSFVDGPLKRMTDSTADYYFPIGDAVDSPAFQPLSLQPPSATADTWTGESHASGFGSYGVFGTLAYVSTAEYWDLASAAAAIPDSLKLWWGTHSAFVAQSIDESNLTIAHYVSAVGLWLEEGRDDYSGIPSTTGWANTSPTFMSTFTFGKGTSLDNSDISALPTQFGLSNVYPNPFNPITTIEYQVPAMEDVNINIFNINGQLVGNLVQGIQDAGQHSIQWNGSEQPSGTYLVRMTSGTQNDVQKIMLVK